MTDAQNAASEQLKQDAKACLSRVANSLVEDFGEEPLSDVGRQYILELISPPAESKLTADQNSEYWLRVPHDKELIISGLRRIIDKGGWTEPKDSNEADKSPVVFWLDWANELKQNPLTSDFAAKYQQEIDTAALESAKHFASQRTADYFRSILPATRDNQTAEYYQNNPQLFAARDGLDEAHDLFRLGSVQVYDMVRATQTNKIQSVIDNAKTTAELDHGMADVLCEYLNSLLGEKAPESLVAYLNSRTPQATLTTVQKPSGLPEITVSQDGIAMS